MKKFARVLSVLLAAAMIFTTASVAVSADELTTAEESQITAEEYPDGNIPDNTDASAEDGESVSPEVTVTPSPVPETTPEATPAPEVSAVPEVSESPEVTIEPTATPDTEVTAEIIDSSEIVPSKSRSALYAQGSYSGAYYNQLNTYEQLLYDAMRKSNHSSGTITVDMPAGLGRYDLSTTIQNALDALLKDHPDMDWLDVGKLKTRGSYSSSLGCFRNVSIDIVADVSASVVSSSLSQIDSIPISGGDRYTVLKNIHDYICNKVYYDYSGSIANRYSVYGSMTSPYGVVCEGYAELFKLLCDRAGIPCALVTSNDHMWNVVQMENGQWYAVDATWDDSPSGCNYNYFLVGSQTVIGSSTFVGNHNVNSDFSGMGYKAFAVPQIASSKYNYSGSSAVSTSNKGSNSLPVPTLSVGGTSGYGITMNWNKAEGVTGYELWISTDNRNYRNVLVSNSNKTLSYTTTGLNRNTQYYFKIKTYLISGGKGYYGSFSSVAAVKTADSAASALREGVKYCTQISVNWDKVSGVTGYELWISEDNRTYRNVTVTKNNSVTSFNTTGLRPNTQYYFKMKTYLISGGRGYYGAFSEPLAVKTNALFVPTLSLDSSLTSRINLSWTRGSVTGYELWVSTDNKTYKNVLVTTSGKKISWAGKNFAPNNQYYFKVKSYLINSGRGYYGAFSDPIVVRTNALSTPELYVKNRSSSEVALSWTRGNDTGYELWVSTNGITYRNILVTKSNSVTSYTVKGLDPSTQYYFKVKSYLIDGGRGYYGSFSNPLAYKAG